MKGLLGVVAAALVQTATAHTIFCQLNGHPVGYGISDPSYDGPIQDVTMNAMACNGAGGPNPTTPSAAIITVAAGSQAVLTWRHTLTSGSNDVLDASHLGPVQAYMKKVTNALTDPGYGSGWFKIMEDGYTPSTNTWATSKLIAAGGAQTVTIPSCIESGQYLLRGEVLALHAAGSEGGAQFYQECATIQVTGGSGSKTPPTVSIPGAYAQNDPGILINIYTTLTTYDIPGPTPFSC